MDTVPQEDGLHVVNLDVGGDQNWLDGEPVAVDRAVADLESVRDEFVEAFNARDLDAVVALVDDDVECPDHAASGVAAFAEEIVAIWDRSPAAILTRALHEEVPCAMGWLPDEDGCWSRAALVTFDVEDGLLVQFMIPDDPYALDAAEAQEPSGDELDAWLDWAEWDRGEESVPRPRR